MVINRIKARKTDSNSFCRKVKDMVDTDYLGMDTDREQRTLVHWRHRRLEDQLGDMHHCTDRSHSHKPGEINIHYESILCYISDDALCLIAPHFK